MLEIDYFRKESSEEGDDTAKKPWSCSSGEIGEKMIGKVWPSTTLEKKEYIEGRQEAWTSVKAEKKLEEYETMNIGREKGNMAAEGYALGSKPREGVDHNEVLFTDDDRLNLDAVDMEALRDCSAQKSLKITVEYVSNQFLKLAGQLGQGGKLTRTEQDNLFGKREAMLL